MAKHYTINLMINKVEKAEQLPGRVTVDNGRVTTEIISVVARANTLSDAVTKATKHLEIEGDLSDD